MTGTATIRPLAGTGWPAVQVIYHASLAVHDRAGSRCMDTHERIALMIYSP